MKFWDFRAIFYDVTRSLFPFNLIFKHEMQNIELLVSKIGNSSATVLDVASGTGAVLFLLPENWQIIRMDSSLSMLKKSSGKQCIVADCNHLPFKSVSFDIITAVGLLEYLKNPGIFFRNLHSLTKDSAKIIFTYAQFNLLNFSRNLIGSKIYFHQANKLDRIFSETGFIKEAQFTSLMQTQVLLKKV